MSRARKELPESLELLLDTMCNTFGGVMFIALSLIIISQLVTKQLQNITPEELDRRKIAQISERIKELEREIKKLKAENVERTVSKFNVTPEKKQLILKMADAFSEFADLNVKVADAEQKSLAGRKKVAELDKNIETLERQKHRKITENTEQQQRYDKISDVLKKEIDELEKALASTAPRKIRFAKNEETNLLPYRILLQAGSAYRFCNIKTPVTGEVTIIWGNDNTFQLVPVRGIAIGTDPEAALAEILSGIDRNRYFVSITTDFDSFPALLAMRQYLRDNGYKAYWFVDPEFRFEIVRDIKYSASD